MTRKSIVTLHLFTAAFLTPVLILIAISGGLYLFGYKGEVSKEVVFEGPRGNFDITADDLENQVGSFLQAQGLDNDFEYVRTFGKANLITRPTSKTHYQFKQKAQELEITRIEPDFVKSLVELHKGHGPQAFKTLQKVTAFGLLFIVISGVIIGLMSPLYKKKTMATTGAGSIITLLLILL